MTTSDEFFERYLRENGYDPGPHEPDLSTHGIRRRPDFLARRGGVTVACEVKQFTVGATDLEQRLVRQQVAVASPKEVYGRIRDQVSSAAGQLKELTRMGIPLVVVLANPERALVDLSVPTVLAALYGNLAVGFQVDRTTGGTTGTARFEFARDGKLTNDHPYVSAVVLLRRRAHQADRISEIVAEQRADRAPNTQASAEVVGLLDRLEREDLPAGDDLYVDVIETISQSAVPLPNGWLDSERDTRWRINEDGHFESVRGAASRQARLA